MPPTQSPSSAHTLAFLAAGVVACLIVANGSALLVVAMSGAQGEVAVREVLERPASLAAVAAVQYAAMIFVAFTMCRLVGPPRVVLGLVPPGTRHALAGLAAGVATVFVASGLAALLLDAFPDLDMAALERFGEAFTVGPPAPRLALALVVAVGAPIAEELIFRGFLWDILQRRMSPWAVLVITSLVFAAWHMQPFHILTLLPTSFMFGFLRMRTGSVIPSLIAHGMNNAIGAVLLLLGNTSGEATLHIVSFSIASAGFVGLIVGLRGPPIRPTPRLDTIE
jgi:membrane protease YdiL (CAAX protease family)